MLVCVCVLWLFFFVEFLLVKVVYLVVDDDGGIGMVLMVMKYFVKMFGDEGVDEMYVEELLDIGVVWFVMV